MGAQAVRLTNVDIDNALKNNHFDVIFQPIFAMADGSLLRMESFVRWTHPGLGVLPPGAFISFFETQGRMGELTRHVIETAVEHYIAWRGTSGPGLSVNLSLSDLTDESFPAWLKKYLKAKKFPAKLLTLECPLPPTSTTIPDANKSFAALTKTGCPLAIEIRGRANEALSDLSPFPFVEVKTGGSAILRFARTVRGGPGLTAISELLEMAKSNKARIVAVGVEDQPSLTALSSLGFTGAQGNFMAGVSDLQGYAMNTVNTVRTALGLDPLAQDQLRAQYGSDEQQQPTMTSPEEVETTQTSDQDVENLSEDEIRAQKIEAAKKAIREKKLKARELAKLRAAKKARDAREAAVKAEIELAEQRNEIEEAKAAAAVAANARKLQDRLSRVFDESDQETPLELNTPVSLEEPSTGNTADMLSDEAASTEETPDLVEVEIDFEEIEPDLAQRPVTDEVFETLDEPLIEPEASAEPITFEIEISADPSPVVEDDFDLAESLSEDIDPLAIDGDLESEFAAAPDVEDELEDVVETSMTAASVEADEDDLIGTEPLTSADLLTEDEILDDALGATDILDPEQITLSGRELDLPVHEAEAALAARLAPPTDRSDDRPQRSKNFLQRRYHLPKVTHFWPRSWTRGVAMRKAEKQAIADAEMFDE